MGTSIDKPLVEFECSGTATLENGRNFESNFLVAQLVDGSIAGSVELVNLPEGSSLIMMVSGELNKFGLEGVEKKNGFKLTVSNCYFARRTAGSTVLKGEFVASGVILKPDILESKIEKPGIIVVSVTNMHKTFRVIVDGPLGKMQIAHDKNIDAMETLMNTQHISLVTSDIQIFIDKPYGKSVRELFEDVRDTVNGFLNITRLAQTCWHDWCSIAVYEKDTIEQATLVALKIRTPWRKAPSTLGLTNPAHSDIFIRKGYEGYRKALEVEHGFESALHWYIESNATEALESKYLLACTSMELLVDRLAKQLNGESVIPRDSFKKLSAVIRKAIHSWFSESGTVDGKQEQIQLSVQALNRPSLRSKIESLLNKWNVKYNDLDLNLQDIINTRNQITHTGMSQSKRLTEEYLKLYVVLTRVFLSMLRYDDDYYDWVHGAWRHQDWL